MIKSSSAICIDELFEFNSGPSDENYGIVLKFVLIYNERMEFKHKRRVNIDYANSMTNG